MINYPLPAQDHDSCVYDCTCEVCPAEQIGQNPRHLKFRVSERKRKRKTQTKRMVQPQTYLSATQQLLSVLWLKAKSLSTIGMELFTVVSGSTLRACV